MAVWAVSDVHGCYTQFQHLLDKASPGTDDEIYILGDVIDRGPKPVEMLRWCPWVGVCLIELEPIGVGIVRAGLE